MKDNKKNLFYISVNEKYPFLGERICLKSKINGYLDIIEVLKANRLNNEKYIYKVIPIDYSVSDNYLITIKDFEIEEIIGEEYIFFYADEFIQNTRSMLMYVKEPLALDGSLSKYYRFTMLDLRWETISLLLTNRWGKPPKWFLDTYKNYFNWEHLILTNNFNIELVFEYKDYIDWNIISKYLVMDYNFIEKHKSSINLELLLENDNTINNLLLEEKNNIINKLKNIFL